MPMSDMGHGSAAGPRQAHLKSHVPVSRAPRSPGPLLQPCPELWSPARALLLPPGLLPPARRARTGHRSWGRPQTPAA